VRDEGAVTTEPANHSADGESVSFAIDVPSELHVASDGPSDHGSRSGPLELGSQNDVYRHGEEGARDAQAVVVRALSSFDSLSTDVPAPSAGGAVVAGRDGTMVARRTLAEPADLERAAEAPYDDRDDELPLVLYDGSARIAPSSSGELDDPRRARAWLSGTIDAESARRIEAACDVLREWLQRTGRPSARRSAAVAWAAELCGAILAREQRALQPTTTTAAATNGAIGPQSNDTAPLVGDGFSQGRLGDPEEPTTTQRAWTDASGTSVPSNPMVTSMAPGTGHRPTIANPSSLRRERLVALALAAAAMERALDGDAVMAQRARTIAERHMRATPTDVHTGSLGGGGGGASPFELDEAMRVADERVERVAAHGARRRRCAHVANELLVDTPNAPLYTVPRIERLTHAQRARFAQALADMALEPRIFGRFSPRTRAYAALHVALNDQVRMSERCCFFRAYGTDVDDVRHACALYEQRSARPAPEVHRTTRSSQVGT